MQPRSFMQNVLRLLLLFVAFNLIGSVVTLVLLRSLFNIDGVDVINQLQSADVSASTINALKFMQFIQVFFSFIIPAHLFARSQSDNQVIDYLSLHTTHWKHFLIGALLIFAISPLVTFSSAINEQITFPSYFSNIEHYFKNQQIQSQKFATLFLKDNTGKDLLINLFVVGVLAAFSEELFFRGVLQKLLINHFNNVHLAILACAILFSSLHQEFYALIPRILLGLLLGYAYVYSKSLWVPILIHFINNASAVLLDSFFKQGITSFNPNSNDYFGIAGVLISFVATIALFWYWQKNKAPSIL